MFMRRFINPNIVFGVIMVYFMSCHGFAPIASTARAQTSKQKRIKSENQRSTGYEELLRVEVLLLSPIVSEMDNTLKVLHGQYHGQIMFWQHVVEELPTSDPLRNRMQELINQAQTIFIPITDYADFLGKQQQIFEKVLANEELQSKESSEIDYVRLAMLIHLREKLGYYEIAAQGILNELYQIMSERWGASSSEIFTRISAFNKLRHAQIAEYFEARKKFDRINELLQSIERPLNFGLRIGLSVNLAVSRDLAGELAGSLRQSNISVGPSGSDLTRAISWEFEQIARWRVRELAALDAVISRSHEDSLWSILFVPPMQDDLPDSNQDQLSAQALMARRLVRSLETMRPALEEVARILTERNRILDMIPLLRTEEFVHLREQIILQNGMLLRLSEIISSIARIGKSADDVIRDSRASALYEELGFLKEELLAVETILLYELRASPNQSALSSDSRWPQIIEWLTAEDRWVKDWLTISTNWKAAVDEFKFYRHDLLGRYVDTLKDLKESIRNLRITSGLPVDPTTQRFLNFIEKFINERLYSTELVLVNRGRMATAEEADPLYAHLFGVQPDFFWHAHFGQGLAYHDLERFIAQKNRIVDNLGTLFRKWAFDLQEQALRVLQIVNDFGIVRDLGRNPNGLVIVFGSGEKQFILEGLANSPVPTLRQISSAQQVSDNWSAIEQMFLAILSPRSSHAGVRENLGNAYINLKNNYSVRTHAMNIVNQMEKNKWTHITCFAGMVGGILSTPLTGPAGPTVAFGFAVADVVQAEVDILIGTARTLTVSMNPAQKKNLNKAIDRLEFWYSIGKVWEGIKAISASFSKVKEAKEGLAKIKDYKDANRAVQELKAETAEKILNATKQKKYWVKEARDALKQVSEHAKHYSKEDKKIFQRLWENASKRIIEIDEFIKTKKLTVAKAIEYRDAIKAGTEELPEGASKTISATTRFLENLVNMASNAPTAAGVGEGIGAELATLRTGGKADRTPTKIGRDVSGKSVKRGKITEPAPPTPTAVGKGQTAAKKPGKDKKVKKSIKAFFIDPKGWKLQVGQSKSFSATVVYSDDKTAAVTEDTEWDYSGIKSNTFKNNTFEAKESGTFWITAKYGGLFDEAKITVMKSIPPKAVISCNPCKGKVPLKLTLTGTGSTGDKPLKYSWKLGDGASREGPTVPSYLYEKPKIYTVSLTVTDKRGRQSTATKKINAAPLEGVGISIKDFVIEPNKVNRAETVPIKAVLHVAGLPDKISAKGSVSIKVQNKLLMEKPLDLKSTTYPFGANYDVPSSAKAGKYNVTVTAQMDLPELDEFAGIEKHHTVTKPGSFIVKDPFIGKWVGTLHDVTTEEDRKEPPEPLEFKVERLGQQSIRVLVLKTGEKERVFTLEGNKTHYSFKEEKLEKDSGHTVMEDERITLTFEGDKVSGKVNWSEITYEVEEGEKKEYSRYWAVLNIQAERVDYPEVKP
jgi:hypothetical protein